MSEGRVSEGRVSQGHGQGRCLVVGSYPPVPGEPAAATVAAVRRQWAAGCEVVVASPRPSAAPVVLVRLGRALGGDPAPRRRHACAQIVLCAEPAWPFVATADRAATARALADALLGARRAELVVSARPTNGPSSSTTSTSPLSSEPSRW